MIEIKKKSQLCFDPRVARRLLKMNGEIKFCQYCGASINEGCACHKNIIIDIKANREMWRNQFLCLTTTNHLRMILRLSWMKLRLKKRLNLMSNLLLSKTNHF